MLLLSGAPGSGKTAYVLEELREALRRKDPSACLLVPTVSMAEHLRHQLAREGFVLRANAIRTLSKFIAPWAEELPAISEASFHLLVERVARKLAPIEFARVLEMPGFTSVLSRTIEEFSSAGCDASRLKRLAPATPFGPPFLAVYEQVERELARLGFGLRAARLKLAAKKIAEQGAPDARTVWIDGFFTLTDPELAVIRAIGAHAELTVTLPTVEEPIRDALFAMQFREQRLERRRPLVEPKTFAAPTPDREATEIARRIVECGEFGRTGIIVRNPDLYLGPLRAALERFGIPARFYFSDSLGEHSSAKFLTGAIEALMSGWDYEATLAAVRLAHSSPALDHFDFDVRECLPGKGIDGLLNLTDDRRLQNVLGDLAAIDSWRANLALPAKWVERLGSLTRLVAPPPVSDGASHEQVMQWRSQAEALAAWRRAMEEAAILPDPDRKISLAEFWDAARAVVRLSPLRVADHRRNVVHVLEIHEARQWELPFLFVCGLVEQEFPKRPTPEPLFADATRARLAQAGVRVRTAAEQEREEKLLFDLARARATVSLTFSYPETDTRGATNQPSRFLEGVVERCSEIARPQPSRSGETLPVAAEPIHPTIDRPFSPTALETFLHCPFQYFAQKTLRLHGRPLTPQERLDFLLQGTIIHETIAQWHKTGEQIEAVFERIFVDRCTKEAVFPGYRAEYLRRQMLDDLRNFEQNQKLPACAEILTEQPFEMEIGEGVALRGRIDRVDILRDGRALIVDYKYSAKSRLSAKVDDETLLQAGLYALAAEKTLGLKAAGVFYYGVKGGAKGEISVVGWSDPPGAYGPKSAALTREWIDTAIAKTIEAGRQIREGRIAPSPANAEMCRLCDFRDVCRYEGAPKTLAAG